MAAADDAEFHRERLRVGEEIRAVTPAVCACGREAGGTYPVYWSNAAMEWICSVCFFKEGRG